LILIPNAKEVKTVKPLDTTIEESQQQGLASQADGDDFIWPISGKVGSFFNEKKGDSVNKGVDIQAKSGEDIKASRAGKIILSDYVGSWGYMVMIDHGDGFVSVYAHQQKNLVAAGDQVSRGEIIAQMGDKADSLHFQIRKGALAVNPLYYLP
jgi:murein DD-endopeptidase MepM/ murein hydrolase activator NlpD